MIKVLIVSESDSKGGASRAAKRLHDSLILSGIHSSMLVLHKATDDTAVIRFEPNFFSLSYWSRPAAFVNDSYGLDRFFLRTQATDICHSCPYSERTRRCNGIRQYRSTCRVV